MFVGVFQQDGQALLIGRIPIVLQVEQLQGGDDLGHLLLGRILLAGDQVVPHRDRHRRGQNAQDYDDHHQLYKRQSLSSLRSLVPQSLLSHCTILVVSRIGSSVAKTTKPITTARTRINAGSNTARKRDTARSTSFS